MLTNGNRAPGHVDTIKRSLQLTFKKETQHMNKKLLKFLKTAFWPFHNPNRETNLTALMTLCGFTLLAICEIGTRAFGWPPPSPLGALASLWLVCGGWGSRCRLPGPGLVPSSALAGAAGLSPSSRLPCLWLPLHSALPGCLGVVDFDSYAQVLAGAP